MKVLFSPQGGISKELSRLIKAAKVEIAVAAYAFSSKYLGNTLTAAQKRGVKIRIILDRDNADQAYSIDEWLIQQGIDTHNDKDIATIIAGHTHRAVFENLSITERRYLESKVKTEIIKIKNEPDASYFNSGSCVHPLSITGLEISFEKKLKFLLIEWVYSVEGNTLNIQRYLIADADK